MNGRPPLCRILLLMLVCAALHPFSAGAQADPPEEAENEVLEAIRPSMAPT